MEEEKGEEWRFGRSGKHRVVGGRSKQKQEQEHEHEQMTLMHTVLLSLAAWISKKGIKTSVSLAGDAASRNVVSRQAASGEKDSLDSDGNASVVSDSSSGAD
ncbi:Hypothetical predicted protein [Olea europaea subsp. europaea]|uniref:Uncharacterized protein n=1 Tax=Olea europaea subsp. europaea TaxID=158383 RepID=A0A8S0PNA3_OLEEU|nr:Hypothetical predicted protein [Olea europaea subsp. europaea]